MLRFEKWEIHKVFLHFPNLALTKNLSPSTVGDSIRASFRILSFIIVIRYRIYNKKGQLFIESLRFVFLFCAQDDDAAENEHDARDVGKRQRLMEHERAEQRADDRLGGRENARAAGLHAL